MEVVDIFWVQVLGWLGVVAALVGLMLAFTGKDDSEGESDER